jgi:hypothetical protein
LFSVAVETQRERKRERERGERGERRNGDRDPSGDYFSKAFMVFKREIFLISFSTQKT